MQLDKILNLFELGAQEKEIFLTLLELNSAKATTLSQKTGLARTAIYDFLDRLIKKGLLIESQKNGIKNFSAQKPEIIELLIEEKQKDIFNAKQALGELKEKYYKKNKDTRTHLQLFEGREELQLMMKDMLLYRDITACVFWPVEKIVKLLGADFYREFHQKRVERNIKIKVIWPTAQMSIKKKHDFLKNDQKLLREVRLAPKNIDFSLGYTIYGNTVRFISSRKENYGFLIESQEMAEMMGRQFEIIWEISKKI